MIAPIDISNFEIETARIFLRPLCWDDADDMHCILSDSAVSDLAGFPLCKTMEEANARMEKCLKKQDTLALVRKDCGKMVGVLTLQARSSRMDPVCSEYRGREIGFFLAKSQWGQGLMPEAITAVCDWCFRCLGYDFITCGHFLSNKQSARAIEKCGFHFLTETVVKCSNGRSVPLRNYVRYNPNLQEIRNV